MKKLFSYILALVCLVAIMLGCAGNYPDDSCNMIWTLSCLAIAALSGWGFAALNKGGSHV